MKKLISELSDLAGKTISEVRFEKDDDYNDGIVIKTVDGEVAFFSSDEERDINLRQSAPLSKWNYDLYSRLGLVTKEEVSGFLAVQRISDARLKLGEALRLMDDAKKESPALFSEFEREFKERIKE